MLSEKDKYWANKKKYIFQCKIKLETHRKKTKLTSIRPLQIKIDR